MATPLAQTTGRRKEAIARARLRPGTGVISVNGRPFESYFTDAGPPHGGQSSRCGSPRPPSASTSTPRSTVAAISGQAGALRMALARSLVEVEPETRTTLKKAGLAHARRAEEGEQEVRPEEGPQGAAVHQALSVVRLAAGGP